MKGECCSDDLELHPIWRMEENAVFELHPLWRMEEIVVLLF